MTDKTMTLEQVRDQLRNLAFNPPKNVYKQMFNLADAITRHISQPAEREQISDGKRQWDEMASILGADGDNVDAVFAAARQLTAEHGEAVVNCRQRLMREGKAYPRSSCDACGKWAPNARHCETLLDAARTAPPPAAGVPDDVRERLQYACDLLAERKYGSDARSPGHNARLVIERVLSATPSPTIDVAAVREVIEGMRCVSRLAGENDLRLRDTCAGAADKLAFAIGDAK